MLRRMRALLGTFVEICIAETVPGADAVIALERAFQRIADLERKYSCHSADSELMSLNQTPQQWVAVSSDLLRVLWLAKCLGEKSRNRFNITVGGALMDAGVLPRLIHHDVLSAGVAADLEIAVNRVRLARPVMLTLDGIAKGYVVDQVVKALKCAGAKSGSVNAGGDLRVFGGFNTRIVQRGISGLESGAVVVDGAVASSRVGGERSRDFSARVLDGVKLNSPAAEKVVSIYARFAWRADAMTKVLGTCGADAINDLPKKFKVQVLSF